MRASGSSMPSKRPIGVSNCSRTVAYAPQMRVAICAAPTLSAGSEIERPAASDSISMRQPLPMPSRPPMTTSSSGAQTSVPTIGPFWNGTPIGSWRRPISMPCVPRAISAHVMPRSSSAPSRCVRILEPEREADQRRDRRERDVALLPVEAKANDFDAIDRALLDDAFGLRRGRIGAGFGAGQREARNLLAVGEARQVFLLLLLGAVVDQQLAGPERVRHHHGHGGGDRAARKPCHDARVRERGEAEPAVFLRDDHAEEALALDESPRSRAADRAAGRRPSRRAAAKLFGRAVEERAFLVR